MYRKEVLEVLQKQFALANEVNITMLPLRQEPCNGQIPTPNPDRHLMSTNFAVSEPDCVQLKIMCLSDRNVFLSKN